MKKHFGLLLITVFLFSCTQQTQVNNDHFSIEGEWEQIEYKVDEKKYNNEKCHENTIMKINTDGTYTTTFITKNCSKYIREGLWQILDNNILRLNFDAPTVAPAPFYDTINEYVPYDTIEVEYDYKLAVIDHHKITLHRKIYSYRDEENKQFDIIAKIEETTWTRRVNSK